MRDDQKGDQKMSERKKGRGGDYVLMLVMSHVAGDEIQPYTAQSCSGVVGSYHLPNIHTVPY